MTIYTLVVWRCVVLFPVVAGNKAIEVTGGEAEYELPPTGFLHFNIPGVGEWRLSNDTARVWNPDGFTTMLRGILPRMGQKSPMFENRMCTKRKTMFK